MYFFLVDKITNLKLKKIFLIIINFKIGFKYLEKWWKNNLIKLKIANF